MKRLYNIEENVIWLPVLSNLGPLKKTMARILPEKFNYYYYLSEVSYEDGIYYVKKLVQENIVYCYRSISGAGGIFEGDDYVEVLCECLKNELEECIETFNSNKHLNGWFFNSIWCENKDIFFYLSEDTTNIYIASMYEITTKMIDNKQLVYQIKREEPAFSML